MSRCVNNVIFILNCVTVLKLRFYIFALNSVLKENLGFLVFLSIHQYSNHEAKITFEIFLRDSRSDTDVAVFNESDD